MFDNQGDGICCEYGGGAYIRSMESSVVSRGTVYYQYRKDFLVGYQVCGYVVAIQFLMLSRRNRWQVEDTNEVIIKVARKQSI
jgi:hypothetical protein